MIVTVLGLKELISGLYTKLRCLHQNHTEVSSLVNATTSTANKQNLATTILVSSTKKLFYLF